MSPYISRRTFLRQAGTVAAAAGTIGFPSILLPKTNRKLGVALVGLGGYSTGQLAPGLQLTEHCELRGIVTGSPEKIPEWQEKYGIQDSNIYNYENMHQVANNDDIDIIYVVTPPSLHAKYSIIGADAGKHVWCEKPMAMDPEECRRIIDAAERNGVQLTIGYRMQHEPNTRKIMEYGRNQSYGAITFIGSGAGYDGYHEDGNWRKEHSMGGGALYDMGVYAINGIRIAMNAEPVAVRGVQCSVRKNIYPNADETTDFEMRFANGVVTKGETSFGKSMNYLNVEAENGWYYLKPMQPYSNVQGVVSDGTHLAPDPGHQQARQMDNDALAIKEKRAPLVPGEEGLRDVHIVRKIMESSVRGGEWLDL